MRSFHDLVLIMGEGDGMGTGMAMGIGLGIRMHCMPLLDHVAHSCQSWFSDCHKVTRLAVCVLLLASIKVQGIGK